MKIWLLLMNILLVVKEIAVSDLNLYKYYRRPGSIVNSSYSDRLLRFLQGHGMEQSLCRERLS